MYGTVLYRRVPSEFTLSWVLCEFQTLAVMAGLFAEVDTSGDGQLSKQEAMDYIRSKGFDLPDVQFDMMWVLIDTDGNGTVDSDEFPILVDVVNELEQGLPMGRALRLLKGFQEHRKEKGDDVRTAEPLLQP